MDAVTLVGDDLGDDRYKWRGAVLGKDGCIYGLPAYSEHVLRFDPTTQECIRVEGDFGDSAWKWKGGELGGDGFIYGVPSNATKVLRVDANMQKATIVGDDLGEDRHKWEGGVLGPNLPDGYACIYGIPMNAKQVLMFDPNNESSTLVGDDLGESSYKWSGGVLGRDGCIYGIPYSAKKVLRFDPNTQVSTLVGDDLGDGWKWNGGALGEDGCIYGIPYSSNQVLRFDPNLQESFLVGNDLGESKYKWNGGVCARDGCIYGIPYNAKQVLRIDPSLFAANERQTMGGLSDSPAHGPDRLGYALYAHALASAAQWVETPHTSLCVGIYAPWGAGKTFLWRLIKEELCRMSKQQPDKESLNEDNLNQDDSMSSMMISFSYICFIMRCMIGTCQPKAAGYDLLPTAEQQADRSKQRALLIEQIAFLVVLFFFIDIFIWILFCVLSLLCKWCKCCQNPLSVDNDLAPQVWKLLQGEIPLGQGSLENGSPTLWSILRFILLSTVQYLLGACSSAFNAVAFFCKCFPFCCCTIDNGTIQTDHDKTKYLWVNFNAWTYSGSDLLWASLIEKLWVAVEREFGKKAVRMHRASVELSDERPDDPPGEKQKKRQQALYNYQHQWYKSAVVFIAGSIVAALLLVIPLNVPVSTPQQPSAAPPLKPTNSPSIAHPPSEPSAMPTIGPTVVPDSPSVTSILLASLAGLLALVPGGTQLYIFIKTVWPVIRESKGKLILDEAKSFERTNFSMGFMGEVSIEVNYLFDFLRSVPYYDKEMGCNRPARLAIFIDDLDRCPKQIIVSVLEAVILLLADAPVTCWLCIDSRIVVTGIEDYFGSKFAQAGVSGHEFLDKIVQLPFCLPDLEDRHKATYVHKLVESNELDVRRVINRLYTSKIQGLTEFKALQVSGNQELTSKEMLDELLNAAEEMSKNRWITGVDHIIHMASPEDILPHDFDNLLYKISRGIEHMRKSAGRRSAAGSNGETSNTGRQSIPGSNGGAESRNFTSASSTRSENDVPEQLDSTPYGSMSPRRALLGVYEPMMNEAERQCLETYAPYLDGKPRKIKRIINVFNVCKCIAEKLESRADTDFKKKLLKFVILLEQWPYRMAWLLRVIEEAQQSLRHAAARGKNEFGEQLHDLINELRMSEGDDIFASLIYKKIVHGLLYSRADAFGHLGRDAEGHRFELLLDKEPAIMMSDLRLTVPGHDSNEQLLRRYAFNIQRSMVEQVARYCDECIIARKQIVDSSARTVGLDQCVLSFRKKAEAFHYNESSAPPEYDGAACEADPQENWEACSQE